MRIESIKAVKILNSRRKPAIKVIVNKKFVAAAPSGASTGIHEIQAFPEKGIDYSIKFLNNYKKFQGLRIEEFEDLEKFEGITSEVGGNPIIALQFAVLKALSDGQIWSFLNPKAKKMPMPLGNVVGGGAHFKGLGSDIQEYLLMPKTKKFAEAVFINNQIHKTVGKELKITKINDEGGWAPNMTNAEIFELLTKKIEEVCDEHGMEVKLGIDAAASTFWNKKNYVYKNFKPNQKNKELATEEQIKFMTQTIQDYNLGYAEDPLHEEDFESFAKLKKSVGKKCLVCGDDLICTNMTLFKKALEKSSVNAIIIKPNQVGSIIKTKQLVDLAHKKGITTVISHRSGETMDATISHLAVAWQMPHIKCGIFGKERVAKLNEVMKIEKELT